MRIRQRKKGHIAIEFAICAMFLLIFTYVCADIGFMIFGAAFNDKACRDAARAAAQSQNVTEATKKANAVLLAHRGGSGIMDGPVLHTAIVYEDFGGEPPAQTSPFVTVTTSSKIKMPFAPVVFSYAVFDASGVTFIQSYTFPIIKIN